MAYLGKTAAVVGGSIAGLASAQMLSRHFNEVVVLERDEISTESKIHKSIPQGNHYHTLLAGGYRVMSELYPELSDRLIAGGAVALQAPGDICFHIEGQRSYNPTGDVLERRNFDIRSFSLTRGLLESTIREITAETANIRFIPQARVTELSTANGSITGVNFTCNDEVCSLKTDLVLETAGRSSRLPKQLESLGYDSVEETTIGVDFGYASVKVAAPDDFAAPEPMHIMFGRPGVDTTGAIMAEVESGLWHVSLAGRLGDYPPGEPEGFVAFARSLGKPVLDKMIGDGDNFRSEITTYRYPRSQWRRYEKMTRFPEGIVPVGDSVVSFNPVYGQGMSSAATQISAVDAALAKRDREGQGLDGLWKDVLPVRRDSRRTS
jgi:2-polyprenyl-6-methoxyphenol hydroxylase-like FAD-dependent oxidoreductase